MPVSEKTLPPVTQLTLAEIETQAARIGADREAFQAQAYKNEHDNFNRGGIETVFTGEAEAKLGAIALSRSVVMGPEFTIPTDEN